MKRVLMWIEDGSLSFDNRVKREAQALLETEQIEVICISPKFKGDPLIQNIDGVKSLHYWKYEGNSILGQILERITTILMSLILVPLVSIVFRVRAIHFHSPTDFFVPLFSVLRVFGLKVVYDQHDLSPELYLSRRNTSKSILYKVLLLVERLSYRLSDHVIVVNDSYKEVAINRGRIAPEKITVLRNGPIAKKFDSLIEDNNRLNNEIINLGYLGNINQADGTGVLVDLCLELLKHSDKFHFHVVGSGQDLPVLKELAKQKKVDERFTFYGRVSNQDLFRIFANVHIGIQPDPHNPLNNISTMNKVPEYMAMGLPFVAFDLKETIVSGGECGEYASNLKDFAESIHRLMSDDELRLRKGRQAYKRHLSYSSWDTQKSKIVNLYKNI
ncbi:glycosyltransferase family 4 protein [Schleiferiaceae bacterium]|nr:glycosyltransferase family 4 protein [Schleiferiaceae bacterium]